MPVFTEDSKKEGGEDGDLLSRFKASEDRNKELQRQVEKVKKKARKGSKSERKEIESLKAKNERSEELLKKAKDELKVLKKKKGKKINKEVADATAANRRENKELKIQNDDLTKQTAENQKTTDHLRMKLKETENRLAVFETYKTDVNSTEVRKLRQDLRNADHIKEEWEDEMKNQESTAERRVLKAQALLAEFQKTNKELRSHNGYLMMRVKKLEERASSGDGKRLEQLEDWNQESRRLLAAKTRRIKELEEQFGVAGQPVPGGRPHVYEDDYEGRYNAPPVRERPGRRNVNVSPPANVGYGAPRYGGGGSPMPDRREAQPPQRDFESNRDRRERVTDEREQPLDPYSKYGAPRPKAYKGGSYQQRKQKALSDSGSEEEQEEEKPRRAKRKQRRRRESSESESGSSSESEKPARKRKKKPARSRKSSSSESESDSDSRRRRREKAAAATESEHEYDVIEIVDANARPKAANGKEEFKPRSILKKPKATKTEPKEEPVIRMWKKYIDPKGRPYYHDHVTGKTQWTQPADLRI